MNSVIIIASEMIYLFFMFSYFHQTSDILITSGSCVAPPLFTTTRTVEFQRADDSAFPNYMLSYNSDPENITVIMDDKKVHIPVYSSYSASRSNFYNLWSMAKRFARSDGVITLLVATAGYADLLTNLMCSTAVLSTHNIIVVTQDTDVALLAEASDVGYFIPLKASTFKEYDDIPGKGKTGLAANFADFGTLSYQELILARCESALSLLLMGYAPVISDIDTFWVYDPIKFVMASSSTSEAISYDIAVTDDHGEICGCFVALSSTDRGIKFWEAVIKAHRNMVVAAIESKKDQLKKFTDSEQKILTDLIYGKQYTGDLKVQLLPKEVFPSGFSYFNVRKNFYGNGGWKDLSRKDNPVAIIHNNFIIGKDLKKVRFERHRIWRVNSTDWGVYREPAMSIADCPIGIGALENCSIDDSFPTSAVAMKPVYDFKCEYNPLNNWEFGFNFVNKDVSIPSITIILPMNNAVLKKNVLRLLVLTEGMLRFEQSIRVYLGTESPTKFHIGLTAVYDMQISTNNNNSILSVVAGVENTNLEVSIDIGYDRSSFAYDLSNKFHRFSSSNAISFQTIDNEANNISEIGNVTMSYSIVVLAFKRPISLQRLLKSLYAADYSGDIVKLTIIIDGPRTEEVKIF